MLRDRLAGRPHYTKIQSEHLRSHVTHCGSVYRRLCVQLLGLRFKRRVRDAVALQGIRSKDRRPWSHPDSGRTGSVYWVQSRQDICALCEAEGDLRRSGGLCRLVHCGTRIDAGQYDKYWISDCAGSSRSRFFLSSIRKQTACPRRDGCLSIQHIASVSAGTVFYALMERRRLPDQQGAPPLP